MAYAESATAPQSLDRSTQRQRRPGLWSLLPRLHSDSASRAATIQETARKNLRLLVTLRWLAVGGQIATIAVVTSWLGIPLPMHAMGSVLLFQAALNVVNLRRTAGRTPVTNAELLVELLVDAGALSIQLYLSGGAYNPFVSLFLLQAVIGAVLLPPRLTWILVGTVSACFLWLIRFHRELDFAALRAGPWQPSLAELHTYGMFLCFLLAVALLVAFVTRINRNLRDRDRRLAALRQQSVEEEHIVRMGLLASGAAHELGSPLSTLSVIVNDWERMPAIAGQPELRAELGEMRAALSRCKSIVSRVLLAAGETRGEATHRTTLQNFLDDVVAEWRDTRAPAHLQYRFELGRDIAIASDAVLRQSLFNVLDNAVEASPDWVELVADHRDGLLSIVVRDRGPGFTEDILARFGQPYQSTKASSGSGLGLFLVVNVLRKLGGNVSACNLAAGGAAVTMTLPIDALSIERVATTTRAPYP